MTGMERLVAAINGQAADRIPVFCDLLDQGAKELGLTLIGIKTRSGRGASFPSPCR